MGDRIGLFELALVLDSPEDLLLLARGSCAVEGEYNLACLVAGTDCQFRCSRLTSGAVSTVVSLLNAFAASSRERLDALRCRWCGRAPDVSIQPSPADARIK